MILQDKIVVITGIGPGMGSKLALEAPRAGAKVALVARRAELLEEAVKGIQASGGSAISVQADVTKPADCARVVEKTLDAYGRIDGLINSAYSMGKMSSIEDANLDDWRSAMEVTLFGSLNMVRAVLPAMKANGRGSIVNIGTMETRKPLVNNGAYNVPKAALQGATRQLAAELGKYNIRVNTAVPGWMWGKPVEEYMNAAAKSSGMTVDALIEQTASQIALGHIPRDEECAKAVIMLLSDYCIEVTGAALEINGGQFFSL